MILHAVLLITNNHGEIIAIPVMNFPLLPVGSSIDIYVTKEVFFETYIISNYALDSRYGVDITVDPRHENMAMDEMRWDKFAEICIKDPNGYYDLIYPSVIDFGVRFPLPPP